MYNNLKLQVRSPVAFIATATLVGNCFFGYTGIKGVLGEKFIFVVTWYPLLHKVMRTLNCLP